MCCNFENKSYEYIITNIPAKKKYFLS